MASEEMFAALVEYRDRLGDCDVPQKYPESQKLATWVSTRRTARKAGKLEEEQIHRLDKIGFVWNPLDVAWDKKFAVLVAYKDRFGDCNVPLRWKENPKLGSWVSKQRQDYRTHKLSEDRVRRFDELGFEWSRAKK